ncbi:MAG: AbrB/MazE/SpoVT family DNA-binding domain-containing protein [Terriglobales bacterium]
MDVHLDRAGRIVLPKQVRQRLHLRAGDRLRLVADDAGLRLSREPAQRRVTLDAGLWVLHTGQPMAEGSLAEEVKVLRAERDLHNLALGPG